MYSSRVLHNASLFEVQGAPRCMEGQHYDHLMEQPGMIDIEFAYRWLGGKEDSQPLRDSRFLDIPGLEMLRRGVRAEYESAVRRIDHTVESNQLRRGTRQPSAV